MERRPRATDTNAADAWLDAVRWDGATGLVPAIAQDATTGRVLTLAWMNREALRLTVDSGRVHYWSRSRGQLWSKGETSGHVQQVRELRLDCDADAVLVAVDQVGGIACHTGRESCFFLRYDDGRWVAVDPVLKDPAAIYGHE
ncbi:MAG: phosphoribosyl-AMP cyclohydrolase [Betaproteobacteria bacterium]|nr:phosphoribosyl-AMP cyclohydrolase [Betaproteobacteria bacterium]MBK7081528.1 phosphoribosyl-AMP cyclohydrolase [Betaproteobacteria bacterium]MBK7744539.1 phosphoribosyl-AMP cyclohydrolase [Betaproteobacteria bacterium]MBK8689280.1 phosphoribosyl-AMP cyclohydrolase [Betaproteobacteria bacterium]MBK9675421.1 phosphoribosyl-AMP cyclohydrolase [Betaproteobacteria bacterium]